MIKASVKTELYIQVSGCLDLSRLYESKCENTTDAVNVDGVIDYIYSNVDKALHAGHEAQSWPSVDAVLGAVDVDRIAPEIGIALLSITLPVKNSLKNRPEFYQQVYQQIAQVEGFEEARDCLRGLE